MALIPTRSNVVRQDPKTGLWLLDKPLIDHFQTIEDRLSPKALSPGDTSGYGLIPTIAGTPTGAPAVPVGGAAIVYDTTSDQLWVYRLGAWRTIGGGAAAGNIAVYPLGASSIASRVGTVWARPVNAVLARILASLWAGATCTFNVQVNVITLGETVQIRLFDFTAGTVVGAVLGPTGPPVAPATLVTFSVPRSLNAGEHDYGVQFLGSAAEVEYEYAAYLQLGA